MLTATMKTHTAAQVRLSPTTSYYIRKLLNQKKLKENEVINIHDLISSIEMLTNADILNQTLPSPETRTVRTIQKLEDLVFLHKHLCSQMTLYTSHEYEVIVLERAIVQILKNLEKRKQMVPPNTN